MRRDENEIIVNVLSKDNRYYPRISIPQSCSIRIVWDLPSLFNDYIFIHKCHCLRHSFQIATQTITLFRRQTTTIRNDLRSSNCRIPWFQSQDPWSWIQQIDPLLLQPQWITILLHCLLSHADLNLHPQRRPHHTLNTIQIWVRHRLSPPNGGSHWIPKISTPLQSKHKSFKGPLSCILRLNKRISNRDRTLVMNRWTLFPLK